MYKTARLNDLINIITDYWDENRSKYFIIQDNILRHLSKENIIKLLNKCDDIDKKEIKSFLRRNNISI